MPTELRTLTVTKAGTGTGLVTSSPAGISCGTDCTEDYASGTSVSLTAAPAGGSVFGGWSGACAGTATCTVAMSESRSVTATFSPAPIVTRVEDTDPQIVYSGIWKAAVHASDSGGQVQTSGSAGASAEYTFTGTGVRWVTRLAPWAGVSEVFLDGVKVATFDGYASSAQFQHLAYENLGLASGVPHTLKVVRLGTKNPAATNTLAVLDAFEVIS